MEAILRCAAFGDSRTPSVPALAQVPGGTRCALLAAVVLGARGHYAAAAARLQELSSHADPLLASLATTTLAAHRRQLGGHANARKLDSAGLRLAATARAAATRTDEDGIDADGALVDALLGLAADNLALGRQGVARRLVDRASARTASWRSDVRACWVSAELELAAGDPGAALPRARRAGELARGQGSLRHVVKSDLVLAAALAAHGGGRQRAEALSLVQLAWREATRMELGALTWPAGVLAAELDPNHADEYRADVTRELHAVLLSSDHEGRRLAHESPWVPV